MSPMIGGRRANVWIIIRHAFNIGVDVVRGTGKSYVTRADINWNLRGDARYRAFYSFVVKMSMSLLKQQVRGTCLQKATMPPNPSRT